MAILRNREVNYLGPVSGHDSSRPVRVEDKFGIIEIVKLNELRFTEDELNDMKEYENHQISGLAVISDKELQELRDSQNAEKIDAKQNGEIQKKQAEYDRKAVQVEPRPVSSDTPARPGTASQQAVVPAQPKPTTAQVKSGQIDKGRK